MADQKHISYSAISMLERCGQQYQFRYIEGQRVPPGIALLQGRAVDKAVTADMRAKIETGELLSLEEIEDTARNEFVNEWGRGDIRLEEEYAQLGAAKAKATGVYRSVQLAQIHHTEAAPAMHPTHVQRRWELNIDGIPYNLVGVIDVQEGLESVRDTKVSGKTPPADAADRSSQLSAYALAVMVTDGAIPRRLVLDYLVNTAAPRYVQIVSERSKASLEPFANRLFNAVRVIEAGAFMPAQPDSWVCTPQWCGYWSQCKYAARPVSVGSQGSPGKARHGLAQRGEARRSGARQDGVSVPISGE